MEQYKLLENISNTDYHVVAEKEEERYYSSSQLKDMIGDPEVFHKKYVTKEIPRKHLPAFDVGSAYHCGILEPHLMEKEFAVYGGKVRRGKEWEKFQKDHLGKTILTQAMAEQSANLIKATQESPIAMDLLTGGTAEQSLYVELFGIKIKVRFDYLVLGEKYSYIADLKSTSGNVKDNHAIQGKISNLQYELSAALYMMAINRYIQDAKLDVAPIKDFYLIFASKDLLNCKTYLLSRDQIAIGEAKIYKALELIGKYVENGWEFVDEIGIIYPPQYEKDRWLGEEVKDELPKIIRDASEEVDLANLI